MCARSRTRNIHGLLNSINSTDRPFGSRRLLVPTNVRALKCNRSLSKSYRVSSCTNNSLLFNYRQTTLLKVDAKVSGNVLQVKHCISNRNCQSRIMEILTVEQITLSTTDFLCGNRAIERSVVQCVANSDKVLTIKEQRTRRTRSKNIGFSHIFYFPPCLYNCSRESPRLVLVDSANFPSPPIFPTRSSFPIIYPSNLSLFL